MLLRILTTKLHILNVHCAGLPSYGVWTLAIKTSVRLPCSRTRAQPIEEALFFLYILYERRLMSEAVHSRIYEYCEIDDICTDSEPSFLSISPLEWNTEQ